jgi:hypothetical protein
MSLAFGILEEEKRRLEKLTAEYDNILKNLPQESVHIREINGKQYLYSIKRKHNKVISRYVGECSSKSVQRIIEQDKLRRIYKQRKKEALVSLKEIGRVLGRKNAK